MQRLPESDKDREHEEYLLLLAAFQQFVYRVQEGEDPYDAFEEIVAVRAKLGIRHAVAGFGMTWEDAQKLLQSTGGLSELERTRRNILIAAIDNIVDFSAAEEYQMISELPDVDEEPEDDDMEAWLAVCAKYNERYARVENMDIEYAMAMAATLAPIPASSMLMYMTMGDERVRPWHLQHEGFTAPKSDFPAWLIPPIEHGCRCYLVEDSPAGAAGAVMNAAPPEMPVWFNRTFKESVALGGRIFSDEHPYFAIEKKHTTRLRSVAQRIKNKYLNGSDWSDN